MKAIIIAIGTELTEGQITNRNATWISDKLFPFGIHVLRHETIADDRHQILASLKRAELEADLLIVTGGLGPTSDDFTREVVCEWSGRKPVYREASWEKIVERLTSRGIEVAESNRQQCYFPEGADVLENLEGTADAFFLEKTMLKTFILPGPPREIAHLWDRLVAKKISLLFPSLDSLTLYRWKCLGKSEASLGEIVETALAPFPYPRGYRASPPYVEVKLWMKQSEIGTEDARRARSALDIALLHFTVARDDEDLADLFLKAVDEKGLKTPSFLMLDLGSDGALTARLLSGLKKKEYSELRKRIEIMTRFLEDSGAVRSVDELPERSGEPLFGLFPGGIAVFIHSGGKEIFQIDSPYASETMRERLHQYHAEKALTFFRSIWDRTVT